MQLYSTKIVEDHLIKLNKNKNKNKNKKFLNANPKFTNS